jgi:hypothetical protein
MKTHRFWFEIVLLGSAIACALALLIATLGAAAGAIEPEQVTQVKPERTYVGMVTCSRCGAKHSAVIGKAAPACTRICVHGGANFALVSADITYLLEGDSNILKTVAGQRARVVGTLSNNILRISSIVAET